MTIGSASCNLLLQTQNREELLERIGLLFRSGNQQQLMVTG